MKKLTILIMALLLSFSFGKGVKNETLFAQMPEFYIEQTTTTENDQILSEIWTNNKNKQQQLSDSGYLKNESNGVFTKTYTLNEHETQNNIQTNLLNFQSTFEEITKLQNQIFQKVNEMFNSFSFYNMAENSVENNKENAPENQNNQSENLENYTEENQNTDQQNTQEKGDKSQNTIETTQ